MTMPWTDTLIGAGSVLVGAGLAYLAAGRERRQRGVRITR